MSLSYPCERIQALLLAGEGSNTVMRKLSGKQSSLQGIVSARCAFRHKRSPSKVEEARGRRSNRRPPTCAYFSRPRPGLRASLTL